MSTESCIECGKEEIRDNTRCKECSHRFLVQKKKSIKKAGSEPKIKPWMLVRGNIKI